MFPSARGKLSRYLKPPPSAPHAQTYSPYTCYSHREQWLPAAVTGFQDSKRYQYTPLGSVQGKGERGAKNRAAKGITEDGIRSVQDVQDHVSGSRPNYRIAARSMRSLTTIRQYASTTPHISGSSARSQKTKAAAAAEAAGRKLTNYGKEFRPQKTFLHQTYSNILASNRIMLICQHNNMSVPELIQLRNELTAAGAEMKVVRLGIFAAALRETRYANLAPLINGPTCVISCNISPEEEELKVGGKVPQGLAGIRKVVEKHRKMILLGGKVDESLVSVEDMEKMVEMPGIQTLRSQVVGLLSQAGGGRLVQLLGMNPALLVLNLDAHAKSGDSKTEA
ncbi:hypothetical protein EC968_000638 [Mortierella alpina]|nr:hypothetical protein EC968_000638 [Mortierella alpina]